jgi:hypothetical protein
VENIDGEGTGCNLIYPFIIIVSPEKKEEETE